MEGGLTPLLSGPGLLARDNSSNSAAAETNTIIVFDVMNVVALLLNAFVLLPALLSPTVSRSSTWMAVMASSIFYTSSYLLLLPLGQRSVRQPAHEICLFQASLIYGAPVLISFSGLSYVVQLYFGMLTTLSKRKASLFRINIMLLVIPTIAAAFMIAESVLVGSKFPETVTIDSTRRYCHITNRIPRITAALLIGIGTVGMMVFEVLIFVHLRRNWTSLQQMTGGRITALAWHKLGRIVVFTIFPFGAFTLNISGLFSSGSTNDKWNMLLPTLPLAAAFIFGSRMDILRAWKFWNAPDEKEAWNIYVDPRPLQCNCNCHRRRELVVEQGPKSDPEA